MQGASIATTASDLLFGPLALGPLSLPNRLAMAPMTRCYAEGRARTELHARCCEQRASAAP